MTDTITVASRVHTAIHIAHPKSGKSAILHGARHPAALGEIGITHGVDAETFHAWHDANKGTPLGDAVWVPGEGELKALEAGAVEYGFQPALDRAAADTEPGDAESTVQHAGPIKATEMAATSDTPNDDSPRSQTGN